MLKDIPFRRNVGAYCEAGKNILVINEKGDVFPCEPLWHKVGNLRQYDYQVGKLVQNQIMIDFRKKMLGKGKCNCIWGCALHTNITLM